MTACPDIDNIRRKVLDWYDVNHRTLPWRAPPGRIADPYHVWLSEIMLQQTTVPAVIPYFLNFLERWPDIFALAQSSQEDVLNAWAGLGYYARARNLHACAKRIAGEYGGKFPEQQAELKQLPGIGDYTSAAIAAIAFGKPAVVVDGNIERIVARMFALTDPVPEVKPEMRQKAALLMEGRADRAGDFAQALMDIGAGVCTVSSPKCMLCPLQSACAAKKNGAAESLPRRAPKAQKPQKYGYVYWLTDGKGNVLLHRRPPKGLLASMTGLPTSEWGEHSPVHPDWLDYFNHEEHAKTKVRHSFTHFDLELLAIHIEIGNILPEEDYFWCEEGMVARYGFPTVFKKAVKLFLPR